MGLEAATYIHQLNPANPVGAVDPKAQGDDHIRMLKSSIQATFPNITGPVTVTHSQLNGLAGAAPTNKVKATGAAAAGTAASAALKSDAQLLLDLNDNYVWTGTHTWATILRGPAGAVGAPTFSFTTDVDSGLYSGGSGNIRVAANGALVAQFDSAFFESFQVIYGPNGALGTPAFAFGSDPDTGFYRFGANTMGLVAGGVGVALLNSSSMIMQKPIYGLDGAVGTPSYTFDNDPDTGMWRNGVNTIAFSSNGVRIFQISSNNVSLESNAILYVSDGDASVPGIAFNADGNTGFYRRGADRVAFTEGGNGFDVGYRNIPQNSQSANYGLTQADSGKHILHPNGGGAGDTFTIPANASVAYDIGTVLTFVNRDSNALSIAITSDTMILAGTGSTGTRTLAANGIATAIKVENTVWLISGTGLS